ncbi:MAG: helix-turn-helix domain-containing protein [Lentisphaerae bacterium]|nr:helix-turn-helix domain-containing protein [Lentisphaerota bacterium]
MPTPLVQSVMRALGVLDLLTSPNASSEGIVLSELARQSGLQPNTLHNLLRSLVAAGYAEAAGGGRYREGPKCRQLGLRNRSGPWAALAKPLLDDLVAQTGEGVVFYLLAGVERVLLFHRECPHPVRVIEPIEPRRHFFSLATSRVLAAWSPPHMRRTLVERWGLPGEAYDGIRSVEALDAALDALRATGWARCLSHGGHVVNLAVPVLGKDDRLIGALGCYLPLSRCTPDAEPSILAASRRMAIALAGVLEMAGA